MSTDYKSLEVGTKIVTTKPNKAHIGMWDVETNKKRRWGVTGVVVSHYTALSTIYKVQHADGSFGAYLRSEFSLVNSEPETA